MFSLEKKRLYLRCLVACALSLTWERTWESLAFFLFGKGQSHPRLSRRARPLELPELPQWSAESAAESAAKSAAESSENRWISNSVLSVELKDMEMARHLADFCLLLEKDGSGRNLSNVGGFQSENLRVSSHPALGRLISLLRQPLCSFLFKTRRGLAPGNLERSQLAIGCQVEHLWVNVNRPGHYNQLHEHGPALLSRAASVIYYPHQSIQTSEAHQPPAAKLRFYEGGRAIEIEPQPGLLVIFPTHLLHEVDPVWFGSAPRISIALNLFVRWLDQPILQAAFLGDVPAVEKELRCMVAVHTCDPELKFQAIHLAAEAGHVELVDLLLQHGADPHALTLEGWCPLCLAAAQGHLLVVKRLQRTGACLEKEEVLNKPIDLRKGFSGLEGALLVSFERGHSDIVDFLTKEG